jgi:hypothetical protein
MYYGKKLEKMYRLSQTKEWDRPYPSHLLLGEAVHGLPGQDGVGLTEPSPQLADNFMQLLLGRTVYPINPVSKSLWPLSSIVILVIKIVRISNSVIFTPYITKFNTKPPWGWEQLGEQRVNRQ